MLSAKQRADVRRLREEIKQKGGAPDPGTIRRRLKLLHVCEKTVQRAMVDDGNESRKNEALAEACVFLMLC